MASIRLVISGRVQGVGFRAFVERQALKHGVRGWVRNRRDGTVEALVTGPEAVVVAIEEDCRRGPRLSRVDRVERFIAEDDGSSGFRQLPTL